MKQRDMHRVYMISKYLCVLMVVLFGGITIISTAGGGPGNVVFYGGHVLLEDDSPLEGVKVTFFWPDPPNVNSDGILTAYTDEDGWYSLELTTFPTLEDFTVTPSDPDYDFSPVNYSFGKTDENDHMDLDFVAIPIS